MKKEKSKSLIDSAFQNPKATLHNGSILVPAEPLDMEAVIRAAIETDDEQEDLDCEGADVLLESIGWPCGNLVAFYWQSMGPMVWESYLNALHVTGDTALIWCYQDAGESRQGIALVKRPSNPGVMSAFFRALIKENGAAFGLGFFGSLPSNTHNKSEETIPEKAVRAAYWDWMKWAENELDGDWSGMAEEVSARARSPIIYPCDVLKKYFEGIDGNPAAWLEKRSDRNGRLTDRAKRAIFDAYFMQSYGPY